MLGGGLLLRCGTGLGAELGAEFGAGLGTGLSAALNAALCARLGLAGGVGLRAACPEMTDGLSGGEVVLDLREYSGRLTLSLGGECVVLSLGVAAVDGYREGIVLDLGVATDDENSEGITVRGLVLSIGREAFGIRAFSSLLTLSNVAECWKSR